MSPNHDEIGLGKAACRKRVISRLLGVFSKQIDLFSSQYWCQLFRILVTFRGVNRSETSVKCARGLNPYQPVPPSSLFVGYTSCKYLSLVFDNAGILEARAVFQFSEIARQHARSAALQPAYEHVLTIILLVAFHSYYRSFICIRAEFHINELLSQAPE